MLVFLVLSFEKSFESPKKITHHFVYFNTSTVKKWCGMSWDVAKRYPLSILLSVSFVQENIQENIFSSNCFLILGDQIKNLRKKMSIEQ